MTTRRSMLAAAGAGLVLSQVAKASGAAGAARETGVSDETIAELVRLSERSNTVLMRGDIDAYRSLIRLSDDFTLMAPFGGKPTRGSDMTEERWQAMGRFFKNGDFAQELVHAYASPDMVVLALIERSNVEVGGLPAQDWALRVTLVYRRENGAWQLAHRHADPLATGVGLEQAAGLARGARD